MGTAHQPMMGWASAKRPADANRLTMIGQSSSVSSHTYRIETPPNPKAPSIRTAASANEPGKSGGQNDPELLPLGIPIERLGKPTVGHLDQNQDTQSGDSAQQVGGARFVGPQRGDEPGQGEPDQEHRGQGGNTVDENDSDQSGATDERNPSTARARHPDEVGHRDCPDPGRQTGRRPGRR